MGGDKTNGGKTERSSNQYAALLMKPPAINHLPAPAGSPGEEGSRADAGLPVPPRPRRAEMERPVRLHLPVIPLAQPPTTSALADTGETLLRTQQPQLCVRRPLPLSFHLHVSVVCREADKPQTWHWFGDSHKKNLAIFLRSSPDCSKN